MIFISKCSASWMVSCKSISFLVYLIQEKCIWIINQMRLLLVGRLCYCLSLDICEVELGAVSIFMPLKELRIESSEEYNSCVKGHT